MNCLEEECNFPNSKSRFVKGLKIAIRYLQFGQSPGIGKISAKRKWVIVWITS
jgi:hypothetical protein